MMVFERYRVFAGADLCYSRITEYVSIHTYYRNGIEGFAVNERCKAGWMAYLGNAGKSDSFFADCYVATNEFILCVLFSE
ncbi:hypothetical protein [Flavipsychrobacter stenotrophus]|uniref:hypothetical protein n=1 Tax=Flavipsychrobacter stenotrophus TaxID=2077091 RepID=UPI0013751570|nr:hypothetical protein [Flavipsychrobacter stenotrophus]